MVILKLCFFCSVGLYFVEGQRGLCPKNFKQFDEGCYGVVKYKSNDELKAKLCPTRTSLALYEAKLTEIFMNITEGNDVYYVNSWWNYIHSGGLDRIVRLTHNIILYSDYQYYDGANPWPEACKEIGDEFICNKENIKNIVCHISNCNTTTTEEKCAEEEGNGTIQTTAIQLPDDGSWCIFNNKKYSAEETNFTCSNIDPVGIGITHGNTTSHIPVFESCIFFEKKNYCIPIDHPKESTTVTTTATTTVTTVDTTDLCANLTNAEALNDPLLSNEPTSKTGYIVGIVLLCICIVLLIGGYIAHHYYKKSKITRVYPGDVSMVKLAKEHQEIPRVVNS